MFVNSGGVNLKPPLPTLIRCTCGSLDALDVAETPDVVAVEKLNGVAGKVAETRPFCDVSDAGAITDVNIAVDCAEVVDKS
jgi:hypothetical protein